MHKEQNPISATRQTAGHTVYPILWAITVCHLLNDTIQSLISAIYPLVKQSMNLSFAQIGLITFTFQCVASLLQPAVGFYTDKRPKPYSLAGGMILTLVGLVMLAYADRFSFLLVAVALVGIGSAVF